MTAAIIRSIRVITISLVDPCAELKVEEWIYKVQGSLTSSYGQNRTALERCGTLWAVGKSLNELSKYAIT